MTDVIIEKLDEIYIKIRCEHHIAQEMSDYFTFEVPGARFSPAYKNKFWDGKIRLLNIRTNTIYRGLIDRVRGFCDTMRYTYSIAPELVSGTNRASSSALKEFVRGLNLPYELREYQFDAFMTAVTGERAVLLSPTASGKSLVIYLLAQWHADERILVIVPTTSLVHQMRSDFISYGANEKDIHIIMSGEEKQTDKRIVISTWQSLHRMSKPWFDPYGVTIGDEAHLFKAKSLTNIMTKLTNCKYRYALTGTLDDSNCNEMVIEGLFGKITRITTSADLIKQKHLAEFDIRGIILNYPDALRKECAKKDYQEEVDFIVTNPSRNEFITKLVTSLKGNTLVLFQFVEKQGKPLFELIKNSHEGKVFYISGEISADIREEIRHTVETEENAIIVASFGTLSTGVNIKNLHNVVFTSPTKSKVRSLQSIGRVLRKGSNKEKAVLYDIADDLKWKSKTNFCLKHFTERLDIYNKEKFNYKIYEYTLK